MRASRTSWQIEPFKEGVPLSYRAAFDSEQFARLREGHIPQQMEGKWFIYYEEPYLFMHRSWTGVPVYRLTFKNLPGGAEVVEALWSRGPADASKPVAWYHITQLEILLFNLLLGQPQKPWWQIW